MINGGASDNDTRICLGKMAQGNPFQDAENVVAKKKRKRGGVSKGDFLVLVMLHLFHVHSLDTLFFRVISFSGRNGSRDVCEGVPYSSSLLRRSRA